ncbi:MAG: hypothetical protein ABIU95_02975 [Burkholderiales bacterium]
MQLERLAIGLRPGTPWEAVDLGIAIARQWWQPAIRVWLATYPPVALVLAVALSDQLWVAALLLWWLKPLFDRFTLYVFSHSIFGDTPSVRATLTAWREIISPGLLRQLTIGRFSMRRAFYTPVFQLERQRGRAASARMQVLGRRTGATATLATIVFLHFETILFLSLAILVSLFTPENAHTGGSSWFGTSGSTESWWDIDWMDYLFYMLAVAIMEPFYVASGFALYLHRRTLLEGWDIELGLRRIQARLTERLKGTTTAALLVAFLAFGVPPPAPAATLEPRLEPNEVIRQVLADPIFGEEKTERAWRSKKRAEEPKKTEAPDLSGWRAFLELIAGLVRVLVWAALAAAVVAILWWARRFIAPTDTPRTTRYQAPETLFGLAVRPESLPTDISGTAQSLIQAGRMREGLSLLYRGALSTLVHLHRVELAQGDTEGDALRAARRTLDATGGSYFAELVSTWQSGAYGSRWPSAEAALALAARWSKDFAKAAA